VTIPSTDGEIIYPGWQAEYQAAILETDQTKLKARIELAEAALFQRSQAETPIGDEERLAMEDAAAALRFLLVKVLGYPDFPK
jgi:hypothetical protein